MKKPLLALCLFFALKSLVLAQKCPKKARLPASLPEISGLARLPDETFWAANDGENPAVLHRIDCRGQTLFSVDLSSKIQNVDWEELAFDPSSGRLAIGDFGNNSNARRDLAIHLFDEKTGGLETVFFDLEDQKAFPPADRKDWNFDLEAMIVAGDSAHLFSKNDSKSGQFGCKHYVVALRAGRQKAFLREQIDLKNRVVAGAALSPDGRELILVGYRFERRRGAWPTAKATLFRFKNDGANRFFSGKMRRQKPPYFLFAKQWEAAQFVENQQVTLSNERLFWQKPKLRTVRLRAF